MNNIEDLDTIEKLLRQKIKTESDSHEWMAFTIKTEIDADIILKILREANPPDYPINFDREEYVRKELLQWLKDFNNAPVVELVDTLDSKSSA